MSEKLTKIDASPEAKGLERDLRAEAPKTLQEFEVLLARYKSQSPEKYEEKLKSGAFAKQARVLGIAWGKQEAPVAPVASVAPDTTVAPEAPSEPEVEKPKRGRPKVSSVE